MAKALSLLMWKQWHSVEITQAFIDQDSCLVPSPAFARKHLGYCRLMQTKKGRDVWGVYCSIAMLSGAHDGVLCGGGDRADPFSVEDISLMTSYPVKQLESAIELLASPEIRLLEWVEEV